MKRQMKFLILAGVAILLVAPVSSSWASEGEGTGTEKGTSAEPEGKIDRFNSWFGKKLMKADKKVSEKTGAPPPSGMKDETVDKQIDLD